MKTNNNHPAYQRIMRRAQRLNPDKVISMASIEHIDQELLNAYISGDRVRVETTYKGGQVWTRTGKVGCSGGWSPVLLLIHRSNSSGSSDTMDADDVVTGVQRKNDNYYLPTFARHVGRTGATATALFGAKAGA